MPRVTVTITQKKRFVGSNSHLY